MRKAFRAGEDIHRYDVSRSKDQVVIRKEMRHRLGVVPGAEVGSTLEPPRGSGTPVDQLPRFVGGAAGGKGGVGDG
jgi:hypothetical protein